jgi:predicted HNH restriction endonuclease
LTLDAYQISTFASSIKETATVSTANATANVTINAITQSILYYTGNATANTTINITGNSTVSLNNVMANGQSVSVVFMSTQGNTAYYVNTYQIDGVAVTPKWQGNSAPTSGNARGIDVYSFTAVKTANATYTVLASQTQFA